MMMNRIRRKTLLDTLLHQTYFNTLDDLLHFSMMENDGTLSGLIAEVKEKVENIKSSTLK